MQDRLLNAYLAGTVEDVVFKAKSAELKAEATNADETLAQLGEVDHGNLARFNQSRSAAKSSI